ncbi:MAG TPA: OmpA family protein [Flavobacteriaceae bacterium]|nr:OmpA family protein [Flavobacteriaceae bacterium]
MQKILFVLFVVCLTNQNIYCQENPFSQFGKFYRDSKSNIIYMPLGEISFADSVISYSPGFPSPIDKFKDPQKALHEPDYKSYLSPEYLSLGCGGVLVLIFTDNGFINMPGDDLYFFEVGPSVEPFDVEISTDGKNWEKVGPVAGGTTSIDIKDVDRGRKQIYYYIRLTDLKSFCPGDTPGSDIDAVGTVSGVFKISLNTCVLFDSDEYVLKEEATENLEKLAQDIIKIGNADILIEGHTDSDASDQYNIILSENRTTSVMNKLNSLLQDQGEFWYKTKFYGESRPIATNETEEGKQKNRRVEIVVMPDEKFYTVPERD